MYIFSKNGIFLMLVTIVFTLQSKAQNLDFSGRWKRNTEKAVSGQLSINFIPVFLDIHQDTKEVVITRTSIKGLNDTTRYSERLHFDGTISETALNSNFKKKSSIQWSADKKELTETAVYIDVQGKEVQNSKETWAFTDDGKSLQIVWVFEDGGETFNMKAIFDKQ